MYLPSGDHCGLPACPDRVSGTVWPVFSFHIHRSLRKRLCCQSGDSVAMTAADPSGDSFASFTSMAFMNSSSVIRSLAGCATVERGASRAPAKRNKAQEFLRICSPLFECGWRSERVEVLYYLACSSLLVARYSMSLVAAGARRLPFLACGLLLSLATVPALAQLDPQTKQLSRDIFQQLIEINTTDSSGQRRPLRRRDAAALARRRFPAATMFIVLGPNDRKRNLVGAPARHRAPQAHALYRPPGCRGSAAL